MAYLIMTKPGCVQTQQAKSLLKSRGEQILINMHDTEEKVARFKANGYEAFPAIFHDGVYLGNYADLIEYLE